MIWLNGRCAGRYWLAAARGHSQDWLAQAVTDESLGEPTQRYYHLPRGWLRPVNTLVLFEEVGGDPAAVQLCQWR